MEEQSLGTHDVLPSASWENLRQRALLLRRVRDFFDQRHYLEVETPVLSADVVIDRHLEPLAVAPNDDLGRSATARRPESGGQWWMQTSPEAHMKRMLAAWARPIYQLARVFRAGERGPLHNPEFTLLEWYSPGVSYGEAMSLVSDLLVDVLGSQPAQRESYRDAFERYALVDPHRATVGQLRQAAQRQTLAAPDSLGEDRDGWLDLLLVGCVQPKLGQRGPTILYDWPASQAALAVVREEPHPVAERFEVFVRGVELANGYHELLDSGELRRRNAAANAARTADGKPPLPEESRLLAAMDRGLPDATGVALGFDRLVMLAAGAATIDEVIAFPIERA